MNNLPDTLSDSNITIVGLGLMGGSLALALKGKCSNITAVETNAHVRAISLEQNIVDYATDDLIDGIRNANILILATPVRTIIKTIIELTKQ